MHRVHCLVATEAIQTALTIHFPVQTQRQDSMKSREIENAVRPNYIICQPHTCFLLYLCFS